MSDTNLDAHYLRYSAALEQVKPDEAETIERIQKVMTSEMGHMEQRYGRAIRGAHSKSHGVVKGELEVLRDLPRPFAQGLFAEPGVHPLLGRLSTAPAEFLDDDVGTARGFALKVLDVRGPRLPESDEASTQDFLLVTGRQFSSSDSKAFLATFAGVEAAAPLPQGVKEATSKVVGAVQAGLKAVGLESANLGQMSHPPVHPLGECYFSQQAFLYGDHVAKFALVPVGPVAALADVTVEVKDDKTALRRAVEDWFADQGADYELRVQLGVEADRTPVEDAHHLWSEEDSPFVAVARVRFPQQPAFGEARRLFVDEALSFSPAHALAAHRPLGSIGRARLAVYSSQRALRQERNGRHHVEPRSLEDVPD